MSHAPALHTIFKTPGEEADNINIASLVINYSLLPTSLAYPAIWFTVDNIQFKHSGNCLLASVLFIYNSMKRNKNNFSI